MIHDVHSCYLSEVEVNVCVYDVPCMCVSGDVGAGRVQAGSDHGERGPAERHERGRRLLLRHDALHRRTAEAAVVPAGHDQVSTTLILSLDMHRLYIM